MRFFLIALILALAVTAVIWFKTLSPENIADIAVEFHGMLFDIILFGVFLTAFEVILERSREIRRYREEIDDFRDWKEDEAKYRILGNIRRLADKNVRDIDLNNCYLRELPLKGFKFHKSNFLSAILEDSHIMDCSFKSTNCTNIVLKNATVIKSDFDSNSNLTGAQLQNAIIAHLKFKGSILTRADFRGAQFYNLDFSGADLSEAILEGVRYDSTTIFPSSFTPDQRTQKGMIEIKKGTLYEMLLREERIKSITNKYNTPFKEVN